MTTFEIKQNDTWPPIRTVLSDNAGPFDLSEVDVVRFHMRAPGVPLAKIVEPATVVDAVTGVVEYDWKADDTDTVGQFEVEWQVTFNSGKVTTFPNNAYDTVIVYEELA